MKTSLFDAIDRLAWVEDELTLIINTDRYQGEDESAIRCARRNIEHARLLLRTVPTVPTVEKVAK